MANCCENMLSLLGVDNSNIANQGAKHLDILDWVQPSLVLESPYFAI